MKKKHLFICVTIVFITINWVTLLVYYNLPEFGSLLDSGLAEVSEFLQTQSCSLKKKPLLFLVGQNSVKIVWEANCNKDQKFLYGTYEDALENILIVSSHELTQFYHVYTVELDNLISETKYYFKIVESSPTSESPIFKFKIPDMHGGKLKIGLLSDSQSGAPKTRQLLKLLSNKNPDIFIHGGDVVQESKNLKQWHLNFMGPLETLLKQKENIISYVPIVMTRGNHDISSFGEAFGITSHSFALTLSDSRWVFIDSHRESDPIEDWLKQETESKEWKSASFRVMVTHIPPYIEWWEKKSWDKGEKHWGDAIKNKYFPILSSKNLSLSISGHSHIYQRGTLHGAIMTIIGGGGGTLEMEKVEDFGIFSVTKIQHHFVFIEVEKCSLVWEVFGLNGEIIDKFSIVSKDCVK